jgi:lactate dehydrogenase-like 2-hydroxyacid dehydrogenase
MERARRLSFIACIGAGYDHYDPVALRARGVTLTNAAGVNADDVAELAFGLLIAAQRRIVQADGWVRNGAWRTASGRRMKGQKLGILGLGAIGRAVATRAEAFGMTVGWSGPRAKDSPWVFFTDSIELARWCDLMVIACRPTPENEGLVGTEFLNALGAAAILVNVSRGSLIDEDALIAALRQGRIAGAALDVFAAEPTDPGQWSDVPNLVLHPHSGGATHEALADGCALAVENLERHFAGEAPRSRVN